MANALLGRAGLELRRIGAYAPGPMERSSHRRILELARQNGLRPATIIDVGAAFGDFARTAAQVFADRDLLLVEPLEEYGNALAAVMAELSGRASWVKAAATREAGTATFHVHRDLVGSSLLRESEGGSVDGALRAVPAIRLDDEIRARGLPAPYLLKLDTQGSELAALDGAAETLTKTELVILEVSFFDFFLGGSSAVDVIAYMAAHDFVPYDLSAPLYRPLDGALAQIDVCFARRAGELRRHNVYATPEQRRKQDQRMGAGSGLTS